MLTSTRLVFNAYVAQLATLTGLDPSLTVIPGALKEFHLEPSQRLFALHRGDGQRLAVLGDRDSAFAAAYAHELAPVSVH